MSEKVKGPVEGFLDAGGVIGGGPTIMSRATYEETIGYRDGKPMTIQARFDQGTWWRQRSGAWIAVAEMSPGHRYNTAAMLMRNAAHHAFVYTWGFGRMMAAHDGGEMAHDSLERAEGELIEQTTRDPQGWLRGTALYRALVAGLTIHGAGETSWQANGRDPVTGEPCEVPVFTPAEPVCEIPACGCSGAAHA